MKRFVLGAVLVILAVSPHRDGAPGLMRNDLPKRERVTVASGVSPGRTRSAPFTWSLIAYRQGGDVCVDLSRSEGETAGQCGRVELLRPHSFSPTVNFTRYATFVFGMATDEVAAVRVEAPGITAVVTRPRPASGYPVRFFVLQMAPLDSVPTVIALDARSRVLRRDRRPGMTGSPNYVPGAPARTKGKR